MIEVKASMNNKNVYKHLLQLKGANQKAAVRSLNRIAKGAKAAASSDLRDRLNIKKSDLEKDMKVKTANYSNPIAQIITISKSKGIGLYKFGGRWSRTNKKGASFMMRKGSRKYIAESFINPVYFYRYCTCFFLWRNYMVFWFIVKVGACTLGG